MVGVGDDYTPQLLGVAWTFTSLSAICVFARFWCRTYGHTKLGWDDFWAAFSLVMSFAMSISWTIYAHDGGTINLPPTYDQAKSIGFVSWLSQTWCITGITTTKIAVAALIMRLQGPSRWRTRALWTLCSIAVAFAIIQLGFVWGQCHPTATLWDPLGHPDGKCWTPKIVVYFGVACSSFWAFTDICLALIPVHMVMNLQLPMRRKVGICVLLSTGIFAAAISIVRTTKLPADLQKNSDSVYQFALFFIWNSLEVNALIISSCIPTLVPLWELATGRGASRSARGNSRAQKSYGSKRSYALNSIGSKSAHQHSTSSETDSSQVYIKIDENGTGKTLNEEGDNAFATTVSTKRVTSPQPGQGIHVTQEVDVLEYNGERF